MTPIRDCLAGDISPEVAVARLVLAGAGARAMLAALDQATLDQATPDQPTPDQPTPATPIAAMRALVQARAPALDALAAEVVATAANHDASGATAAEGIARIAAFFDRAVQHSPEASVALYSLGDPAILAAATAEIVAWLRAANLVHPAADVLDLGCGIGRIAAALAPHCRAVLGLDVSPGMVAEAARRLAAYPNVTIGHTGGADLDGLAAASFDLILAIDSFPYIVQSGTARHQVHGAARALRPAGALCILNLSYRCDPAADRADAAQWAHATGLTMGPSGDRPFRLWDGAAFILRR